MRNPEIARRFERLADLLAINGNNKFKTRAFRRSASIIESLSRDVSELGARFVGLQEIVNAPPLVELVVIRRRGAG